MGENVSTSASVNDVFEGQRSLSFDLSKMSPPRGRGRKDGIAKWLTQVRFARKTGEARTHSRGPGLWKESVNIVTSPCSSLILAHVLLSGAFQL